MKKPEKIKIGSQKKYNQWIKSAEIANRYGKDGWISTLKNAIDALLIKEYHEGYNQALKDNKKLFN